MKKKKLKLKLSTSFRLAKNLQKLLFSCGNSLEMGTNANNSILFYFEMEEEKNDSFITRKGTKPVHIFGIFRLRTLVCFTNIISTAHQIKRYTTIENENLIKVSLPILLQCIQCNFESVE